MTKLLATLSTLLLLGTMGCQQEPALNEITSVEVLDWDSEEHIANITDKKFINDLVQKLENADTNSTMTMDFRSPDYKLLFKNEDELQYEFGYYNEVMKLGVDGRYLDYKKERLHAVKLELPIEK